MTDSTRPPLGDLVFASRAEGAASDRPASRPASRPALRVVEGGRASAEAPIRRRRARPGPAQGAGPGAGASPEEIADAALLLLGMAKTPEDAQRLVARFAEELSPPLRREAFAILESRLARTRAPRSRLN